MKDNAHSELPFRFDDPRQRRIYENLKYIGPGPAESYRDACQLMQRPEFLRSTSHLVAHLIREIESAIRTILKPVALEEHPTKGKQQEKRSHPEVIEAILQTLGLQEDDHLRQAWRTLARECHQRAHRRALDYPRPVDDNLQEFWERAQLVFDAVAERVRTKHFEWVEALDWVV